MVRGFLMLACAGLAEAALTAAARADAPTRGGQLVYARYADSLQLDPAMSLVPEKEEVPIA